MVWQSPQLYAARLCEVFMYTLLLAVIYLAFVSLGLPDTLLGAAWPAMRAELAVPLSLAGAVTMLISASTIISSLFAARIVRRIGTKYTVLFSVLLTASAMLGFSFAPSFVWLCLFAVPYGLGAGAIDAALNHYVALHYSARHLNWLHCFWGVGTILSPYVMSLSLSHSTWRVGYRTVALLLGIIFVILLLTLPLWKRQQTNNASADAADEATVVPGMRDLLAVRGLPFQLFCFMAYCGAESTVMLWASSYLVQAAGFSKETAAALASLFCIGMTVGRFAAGFVSERMGDARLIRVGTAVLLTGVCCTFFPARLPLLAAAGFAVIGLGCAPIYPAIVHSTPAHFGAELSQSIIGIQMAAAYVGSTFAPPLFGLLADAADIRLLPVYLIAFFGLMILLWELAERICRRARGRL